MVLASVHDSYKSKWQSDQMLNSGIFFFFSEFKDYFQLKEMNSILILIFI